MRRSGLGLAAGLLVFASLPPRGWWVAGLLAVAVLSAALSGLPARQRALVGAATGVGWFVPALAWVYHFSAPGYLLLAAGQALLLAGVCALCWRWWGLPALLVAFTAVRDRVPFGGFPLAGFELGQVGGPGLWAAPLFGGLGVVAAVALAGTGLAAVARDRRRPGPGLLAVLAAGALVLGGALLPPDTGGPRLRVAVVQGGGPRGVPAVRADSAAVLARQLEVTRRLRAGQVDLVVWPEDVVAPDRPLEASPEGHAVAEQAHRLRVPLLVGVVEPAGPGRFRNAAVLFDAGGAVAGRYDKVHRVPFGEYVPGRSVLRRLVDLSLLPADAVPGRRAGLIQAGGQPLGVVISYEVFFSDRTRAAVRAGGRLLLLPTNAASYTGSAVPAEEIAASRLRARETARWLVQAAPTGYSAVVDSAGSVRQRSQLGQPALLTATVGLSDRRTPYTVWGDLPMLAAALVLAAGASPLRWCSSGLSTWWPCRS